MKYLYITLIFVFCFFSCKDKSDQQLLKKDSVQNSEQSASQELKKKELELKEKELDLKEKELQQQKLKDEQNTNKHDSPDDFYRVNYGRFPETSERYLKASYLYNLSQWDLKVMRNEIFARYGYIFQTDDMRNYFSGQSWYTPRYSNVNKMLTTVEKANVELIKSFER